MKSKVSILIVILTLVTTNSIVAQSIRIPDENFKKRLILLGIDKNGNNEIEKSEAEQVTKLYVDKADIFSLEGIKHFVNLEEFGFYYNKIRSVDFTGMKNLKRVYGFRNEITEVNLKNSTSLETINFDDNQISKINLEGCSNLWDVKISRNNLISLDISNLKNLKNLYANRNSISNFEMLNNTALEYVNISENSIRNDLDFSKSKQLEEIIIYNNPIQQLNIRDLIKLVRLDASYTKLTNLNFAGTENLKDFQW